MALHMRFPQLTLLSWLTVREYPVYAERDAKDIPWVKNGGVEYVLECTGFYTSAEKSQAHLDAGAKKVLISAPAKDDTTPTVVYGVNHDIFDPSRCNCFRRFLHHQLYGCNG